MSDKTTTVKRCSRCGTAVESCAFCDEPGCPAVTCYRCVSVAFLDRLPPKATASSRAPS
jgi:hypothetical protein